MSLNKTPTQPQQTLCDAAPDETSSWKCISNSHVRREVLDKAHGKIIMAYHVGEGLACLQQVLAYRKRNLPCGKAGLCLLLILSIVWAPSDYYHSHQVYGSDVRKQLLTAHDSQQSAGRPPGRCALENAICSHLTLECSWQAISVPARSVVGPRA